MSGYREYRYWSPILGCSAVRLMMVNHAGQEYFAIVAADVLGREWRERRDGALLELADAIERGDPPGQVEIGRKPEEGRMVR